MKQTRRIKRERGINMAPTENTEHDSRPDMKPSRGQHDTRANAKTRKEMKEPTAVDTPTQMKKGR